MKSMRQLTAIIQREDDQYVALCPELDIASQGQTVEAARTNLIEALELFFESADPTEVARRPLQRWATSAGWPARRWRPARTRAKTTRAAAPARGRRSSSVG